MILHMLPIAEWEALVEVDAQTYRAASLESEGFIHCTKEPELLVRVANSFYREIPGPFTILHIEEALVEPEVRWEEADAHIFPHIYGPLNLNAVAGTRDFPRAADGAFLPFKAAPDRE